MTRMIALDEIPAGEVLSPIDDYVSRGRMMPGPGSRGWRVFLDGQDVTDDCNWVNDRIGKVVLLLRDEDGRRYLGLNDEVARIVKRGVVRYVREAP